MNEEIKKALDLLEHIRKSTLETDIDEMGGLVWTDESCFENEINKIKDTLNQAEENEKELIAEQHRLFDLAKEHEKELTELREFVRIMASRRLINPRLKDSAVMFYDVEKRHSETEFDLVKWVVEKYGN